MITIQDKKDCCGCNACVQRCPKRCISMHEDSEGFLYPKVDESLCIDCGLCEKVCPVLNQRNVREPLEVFAAKNPNNEIRCKSSSGGIFTMLAERTIDNGGVVFGVGFDKNWEVEHQYTETKEGLAAFRGSKYVQSRIGETFKQAEAFLKLGREVLFSGTPCQIAGFKLFLCKEYDNLLTVDFICHGVPSPGIWHTYLNETIMRLPGAAGKNSVLSSLNSRSVIRGISFRDKRLGWKKFGFEIRYAASKVAKKSVLKSANNLEETQLYEPMNKNPFLRGFLADLYLRPSCHTCPAKKLKSESDITIADYWRIHESMSQLDDDKGISAILVNTAKGKYVFNQINADKYPANYEDICFKNSAICKSPLIPLKRKDFFVSTTETFGSKIERLLRPPFSRRVRGKLSAIKYKIKHLLKK